MHVENEPGNDGADVGGVPEAVGVGFAHADVAVEGALFEKLGSVIDGDLGRDGCGGIAEVAGGSVRVVHDEMTLRHPVEESDDHLFGEAVLNGEGLCAHEIW